MSDAPPGVVRAIVVDDEPNAREAVTTLLQGHPVVRVVGEATNGAQAVGLVRELRPDLMFLDVQMPELDGFGVIEALAGDVPPGVVFVTAHDEHAIRAFEVHALDYVLKPFGRPRFDAAVERALEGLRALDALTLQRTLASMAVDRRRGEQSTGDVTATSHRRLGVRNGAKVTLVDITTIDWVEASGDYARIHAGTQSHVVSQRMNVLEQTLLDAGDFIRIHRSLIVNLTRIRELHRDADGGGTIVLTNGVRLRVARARWEALQAALSISEV